MSALKSLQLATKHKHLLLENNTKTIATWQRAGFQKSIFPLRR